MFSWDDFEVLAGLLKGIEGTFIMSLNDTKDVRRLFRGFRIETVKTTYTLASGRQAKKVSELLISGRNR